MFYSFPSLKLCFFFSFCRLILKILQSQTVTELKQFDELVDEKCRLLNKNGTSHGSALHLAQWMKGQFDESVSYDGVENSISSVEHAA